MNPTVEAARIALIGTGVGVGGTVTIAIVSFRTTLASVRKQIGADRNNRVWEKQAETYTDAITMVQLRTADRQAAMRKMLTGAEPEATPTPVDPVTLNARIVAYASPGVLSAVTATVKAQTEFETAISLWAAAAEQARLMAADGLPTSGTASGRDAARKALDEANRLDDVLMDTIRGELHARTDQPALPVPLARPALESPE